MFKKRPSRIIEKWFRWCDTGHQFRVLRHCSVARDGRFVYE